MANIATFSAPNLNFYFQSQRAGVDSKAVSHLVQFVQAAKHSLDVAIYDLKNPEVLTALKKMSGKVQLNLLYDPGKGPKVGAASITVDPKTPTVNPIIDAGLGKFAHPVQEQGSHLMHNKFIIRDGASVWTGSGNFTNGGLLLQDNNFLTIDSPAVATAYAKTFGNLLGPGHSQSHGGQGVPGAPSTVKVGNIPISFFFSTQMTEVEGLETEITTRLKGAKKIRIMAMLISDPGILASLEQLQKKDIKGVLDPHEMKQVMKNKSGDPLFWFANGDKRFVAAKSHAFNGTGDKNDFMHNKVMIIDDKVVITGSYNFSENAERNDENMLVIESPSVAKAYDNYFNALFAQYQKHGAKLPPA